MNFEGSEFEGRGPLPITDLANSATRPIPLDVTGLSHIDISATGVWGIQQGLETGPAGDPNSLSDTTEAYPAFGISGLKNAPLNLLVGVFTDGTLFDERQPAPEALTYPGISVASPALCQSFPIGALSKSLAVPEGATRLYLGIHDGYEWVNNVGTVTVVISSSPAVPTDIGISSASVPETRIEGTLVGTFNTIDPNSGDSFTYSLVPGTGNTNNASFEIVGNQLRMNSVFDFETKNAYSVRVRTTDQSGLFFEKSFTITVTNVNEAPTNVALSATSLAENAGANAVVGNLSSSDPDAGNTFTYSLVSGAGSTDNAAFNIAGNQLRAKASFDFESKNSYSVRVRTTDQGGLAVEKTFVIGVGDVVEAPSAPTGIVGTPDNGRVMLTWAAPASTGGSPITDYVVQFKTTTASTWSTFVDGVSSSRSATITGLTNGMPYLFRVAAKNVAGVGAYSANSAAIVPRTVPAAPGAIVGTPANGRVTLTWAAPASNGGAAITDYVIQYRATTASTWITFGDGVSASRSATITGLTNKTSYVFRIAAKNAAGTGAFSAISAAVTPRLPTLRELMGGRR